MTNRLCDISTIKALQRKCRISPTMDGSHNDYVIEIPTWLLAMVMDYASCVEVAANAMSDDDRKKLQEDKHSLFTQIKGGYSFALSATVKHIPKKNHETKHL
jgi:hypothetical protein